jgi:linoleoyl-CoA desaturase
MAAEYRPYKFREKVAASPFSRELKKRIDAYFREHHISQYANVQMIAKTVLGACAWIGTYLWLMTGAHSPLGVVGLYVIHGFAQLHMGLNIGHDAVHNAYSRSRRINQVLGRVFDLVGLSSYMWRLMHNHSHHYFVNIRGADTALATGSLFRLSPHDERRPFHRFQHLYALFFYCLATLDWVLAKDYRWLLEKSFGNRKIVHHPPAEVFILFAGKGFYYTYTLALPLLFLDAPWYAVILGFVVMHVFLGLTLALTFQPNHFTPTSSFPEPDEGGHISNTYIRHVLENTADYARRNPLMQWLIGGLNLHVIHHLFPGVCHVHYPALTRIIKSTAEEYGIAYRENRTLVRAFLSHLRWLKILGHAEPQVTP